MYDPSNVLAWLEEKVEGMRRSRMKTLASIVSGAVHMQGSGALALGRMCGDTIRPIIIADRGFGHPRWLGPT